MHTHRLPARSILVSGVSLVLASPLLQAAPALEEIIVTAEKREESLQDVPISIAAFDDETLRNLGINDLKDISANIPNLSVNEFTGAATTVRLFVRGVGQNDVQVTQDPSVALYMDGVYIGSSVGTAFESADIRRIEVLRGPQGTLYGRNATGGAINLITNTADPEAFTLRAELTAGNYDLQRGRLIVNAPITDTAAVKLAYSSSERDGVVDNLGNGEDFGIEDRDNLTLDFHWDMADNHALDYKAERSTIEDSSRLSQVVNFNPDADSAAVIVFENPATDAQGFPVEATSDRLEKGTAFDREVLGDVEIEAHTLTYAWEISDNLTFKSISGYRDVDAFNQTAQSPTTSIFGLYTITDGRTDTSFEQLTQEFQLLGFSESLNWVAGLYYYDDESEDSNTGDSNGSEQIPAGELIDSTTTDNTSVALYGQVTWSPGALDGRWHFTLGARYSDDNREATRHNNRVSYGFGGAPSTTPAFIADYDKDFSKFNPAFTVEYDLSEFSNVYAKVVTAYKSGGTSQRSTSQEKFQHGFDEEDLTSYELGFKGDFLDSRLRVNSAIFYMDYEGYQQSLQTGRGAGERDFFNIDDATIAGLELDVNLAITDNLTGSFSYGYLDSSFGPDTITYPRIDDDDPSGFSMVTDTLTDDLAMAAEHSATLSLDYSRELSIGLLSANASYQYQDESLSGVVEPTGVLDDRGLLSATLGLSEIALGQHGGQLRLQLWGRNLLDEEYYIGNIIQVPFFALGLNELATFGDPRTYGLTLEYLYN